MEDEPTTERICAEEGCEEVLGPGTHHFQRYCETHRPPAKVRAPKKDRKPPSVNIGINIPKPTTSRKDAELQTLEERAAALAKLIAALVAMMGQPDDALDIQRGAEMWAKSVRQLGVHEDWVRKLAAGGEASDRAMAWVGFVLATGSVALPILLRHDVMPAQLVAIVKAVAPEQASEPDGAEQRAA